MTCVTVLLYHTQALLVIVVEKFFLKIPRVAGKIERFYINIVQGESWPQRRRRYTNVVVKGTRIIFFYTRVGRRNSFELLLKPTKLVDSVYGPIFDFD